MPQGYGWNVLYQKAFWMLWITVEKILIRSIWKTHFMTMPILSWICFNAQLLLIVMERMLICNKDCMLYENLKRNSACPFMLIFYHRKSEQTNWLFSQGVVHVLDWIVLNWCACLCMFVCVFWFVLFFKQLPCVFFCALLF